MTPRETTRQRILKEGIYTVTVQAQGFREVTVKDVRLTARQIVRTDLKLVVGAATENVTVEANAELINTESQAISASVTSTEVLGLPANYRGAGSTSPYNLLAFLPGVTGDKDGNISVQGTGINQVEYTMDGINTSNIRYSGPQKEMFPSAESISEMKVQGAGGGAEYGGAADITTTSKSGTNAFHGSAFEYFQNAALDATRFTVPRWLSLPKAPTHSEVPLADPSLGSAPSSLATTKACATGPKLFAKRHVPTQAMRNGDFTGYSTLSALLCHLDNLDGTVNSIQTDRRDQSGSHRDSPVLSASQSKGAQTIFVMGATNFVKTFLTLSFPTSSIFASTTPLIPSRIFSAAGPTRTSGASTRRHRPTPPSETDFEHDNQIVLAHNYAITPNLINELRVRNQPRQSWRDLCV